MKKEIVVLTFLITFFLSILYLNYRQLLRERDLTQTLAECQLSERAYKELYEESLEE